MTLYLHLTIQFPYWLTHWKVLYTLIHETEFHHNLLDLEYDTRPEMVLLVSVGPWGTRFCRMGQCRESDTLMVLRDCRVSNCGFCSIVLVCLFADVPNCCIYARRYNVATSGLKWGGVW